MGVFYMFEFLKKKRAKRSKYQIDSENLAVPEIHIEDFANEEMMQTNTKDNAHSDSDSPITVDTEDVAVPEIHIHKN